MKLGIVREPKLGIDYGYISKLLPYLNKTISVTVYGGMTYKTVKKINQSFDVFNIQYPHHFYKNPVLNHIYFLLLFRKIKIKKTITMHGFVTKDSNKLLGLVAPAYYRLLNPSKVVLFSELQANVMRQYHVRNVVVVPHGCDKCNYHFERKPEMIFFHGFLRESKGIEILINSVKRLLEEGCNVYLNILGSVYTGEEAYAKKISDMLEKEIPNNYVMNVGIHTDEEIAKEASNSYVIVLPYTDKHIEVSGVLHAIMACGTPIIASNTPRFISELTNDYDACIVEPNEIAISGSIKKLLNDKEYWNMLSANIRKKSEECQWDIVAQNLIHEFTSL